MTTIELKSGERIEELDRNGYRIIQNPSGFRFGMDAVLLSDFARVREGERVLDLGTGTGVIPILLLAKNAGRDFTGLEILNESADMAARSVRLNGLEEEIKIKQGDLREAAVIFGAASFDVITCNPPYMTKDSGLCNPGSAKAVARHEILCTFEDVSRETEKLLKPGGRFFLVHRPFRLAEIMGTLCSHRLEPKRMRLVYPFADREPNMVLIEAIRGAKPNLTVEKPLIVFKEPGVYTDELREIYGGKI